MAFWVVDIFVTLLTIEKRAQRVFVQVSMLNLICSSKRENPVDQSWESSVRFLDLHDLECYTINELTESLVDS